MLGAEPVNLHYKCHNPFRGSRVNISIVTPPDEVIESAFRALSAENKPYVTKEELYQNLTKEQADYCLSHMKPYLDSKGRELPSAFDFVEFTRSLFVN
uniref:EF-hand Ca insensitive domain-containing protein n=1 Tax=Astatotilapia calliptera TaxID=8154 RepID=A0AAX7VN71_ASTCA